jgi:hypothetical protein
MSASTIGRLGGTRSGRRLGQGLAWRRCSSVALLGALVLCPCVVQAQDAAPSAQDAAPSAQDSLPGSEKPPGLGLSPQAPPTPPAPGGRAPSFGAPTQPDQWSFNIKGRFSGWESVGIGRRPSNAPADYYGTALHVPARVTGKQPFWAGAGLSLFFTYGNPVVSANVALYASLNGRERRGYYDPGNGPNVSQAYLGISPDPLGSLRLRFKVGAFSEFYGGPGQWGWGIFGPLLAIRGYGELTSAELPLSPNTQLSLAHGVNSIPSVPEEFVRGTYTWWVENARSTLLQHAHAGVSYQNQYTFRLHFADARGTDEQTYLADNADTPEVEVAHDGRMDVYVAEARWVADPYGQLGVSGAFWDFDHATAVHDGIWWGLDWTAGSREMLTKFVGQNSQGNGQLAAVSAEYDFSVARMLWHPRSFDGRAPDVRVRIAGIGHWTVATDDPAFEGASGYMLGNEIEYQMLSWFSAALRSYGESRDYAQGRWVTVSLTPALEFRSDWQSQDRLVLAYSRLFYSSDVDNNPAQPLDRDVVTIGAYMSF